jgi:hypothetical protein
MIPTLSSSCQNQNTVELTTKLQQNNIMQCYLLLLQQKPKHIIPISISKTNSCKKNLYILQLQ